VYTGSIPVLASTQQVAENTNKTELDVMMQGMSTDFKGTPMRIDDALTQYKTDHLDTLKGGAERLKQLNRVLEPYSSSDMHTVSNVDLTKAIGRWQGSTRNRYRAALTHFWKWGRANGYTDLYPTLLPGKEKPRDAVLSMDQLRELYRSADFMPSPWNIYAQLMILTGQRHSDLMRFHMHALQGDDLHLPTSKNGMPHVVTLGPRGLLLVRFCCVGFNMSTTAHFKKRWFRHAGIPLKYRMQDIRRSFATHLCESGENENDVDRMLNHCASQTSHGVARTYNRARRLTQRREIAAQWERLLFPDGFPQWR
jgi:integrase